MRQVFIDSKDSFLSHIGNQNIFDWKIGDKGFFTETLTDDDFKIMKKNKYILILKYSDGKIRQYIFKDENIFNDCKNILRNR